MIVRMTMEGWETLKWTEREMRIQIKDYFADSHRFGLNKTLKQAARDWAVNKRVGLKVPDRPKKVSVTIIYEIKD